jgi:hypothetical protein
MRSQGCPKVPMVHRLFFGGALVHQSDAERPGGHDAMAALMSLSLQPRCIKSFTASLATCCSANVKGTTDPPLPRCFGVGCLWCGGLAVQVDRMLSRGVAQVANNLPCDIV